MQEANKKLSEIKNPAGAGLDAIVNQKLI